MQRLFGATTLERCDAAGEPLSCGRQIYGQSAFYGIRPLLVRPTWLGALASY
jgi:hypothetical protein